MYLGLVLFFITFVVLSTVQVLLAHCARAKGSQVMTRYRKPVVLQADLSCDPPNSQQRKRVNQIALALSLAAMAFGLFWLFWILSKPCAWAGRPGAGHLHPDDAATQ
jgi:hypothetical protein